MKRYIKASTKLNVKLPSLEKAINEAQSEQYDDGYSELWKCDFRYWCEDDGVEGTMLVWLADYNEYIGSSEFYEYSFISRWFDKFNAAVAKDTGYPDFMFDPYDSVDFVGRTKRI